MLQKIENYKRALAQLEEAVDRYQQSPKDTLYRDGLIQRFEFTVELAWKSMKEYLEDQGMVLSIASPRGILKEAYAAVNPNAEIEVQQSDSTTGMQSAIDGICDIGMASRAVKDSEIEAGLTATTIALDGLAVIVNLENPVENMTLEQVKNVFTGATTDWSEIK